MKLFQVLNNVCHSDYSMETLASIKLKFSPEIVFVEAPDYVFEGWGYQDGVFAKPIAPEGWTWSIA